MPFRWIRFTEPILKIILPILYVSVELYFDHPDGFQYLRCPEGPMYAGRFALSHITNWQHASTYPPVVLSGIVDLLSTHVPLPQGTGHVFLAVAFAVQAFVMGTHEKHLPQDKMVHWLLFVSMLLCFIFVVLELHAPKNPLPALGRGAAAIFQGAWLCVIGAIEFENLPQWTEEYSSGVMLAPVYFVTVAVLVLSAIVILGLFMAVLQSLNCVPRALLPVNLETLDAATAASYDDIDQYRRAKQTGNGVSGQYLELCRRDTAHGDDDELLPLSAHTKTSTKNYPAAAQGMHLDANALDAFENDSARHTKTSSVSSGQGSPRGQSSFAFAPHHNPQDLV